MSPNDTKLLGDLHDLPDCAPAGLKALFTLAEGVIQEQVKLLGSGTPSKAPDLRQLLRDNGIAKPEDQSAMIEKYGDHQDKMEKVKSNVHREDAGIVVRTAGIGEIVTKAYDAIDTSLRELNTKIDASHNAVLIKAVRDEHGNPVKDTNGNVVTTKELPQAIVNGLFKGVWDTLNTTFEQVNGVSDQAAAEAVKIRANGESFDPSPRNNGGGVQPVSNRSSGYRTPWSPSSGSISTEIIPTGAKPAATEMMEYLINEHHFTPAQAAGIVANAYVESAGFDLKAKGDNGTAKGLFQWRFDRQDGFWRFASQPDKHGKPRDSGDWKTHIDYMVQELHSGGYEDARRGVDANPNNASQVAQDFDWYYEKSDRSSTGERQSMAVDLLGDWNNAHRNVAV
ncbi:phage tail tip lysozyme [Nocardia sp. NBC_01009]|uniref:phage tail tip lysozyme n=1 Tax=Nocardia sp. NBC_01009 TaxID=2975996 RepID=UPI003870830D|nr:phage tail tip lysozyme [Nocardia sp. NBC_01009]